MIVFLFFWTEVLLKKSTIAVFFASETGRSKAIAFELVKLLKEMTFEVNMDASHSVEVCDLPFDLAETQLETICNYDFIIFGCPTWNIGELQVDLAEIFENFDDLDLNGKQVAIYGLGDQDGYPETYQDAMGLLAVKVIERGAQLLGKTKTEGHHFSKSLAVERRTNLFYGLALDEDIQPHLTEERLKEWSCQLEREYLLKTKDDLFVKLDSSSTSSNLI